MSHEIEYTAHAQGELEEVYRWIKTRAPLSAIRWREEVIAKVESLAENPSGIGSLQRAVVSRSRYASYSFANVAASSESCSLSVENVS